MSIDTTINAEWTRKHDDPREPLFASVPRTMYPKSLEELIAICRDESLGPLKAAGSHWALSPGAISDETFIETHDPHDIHRAMGRTLKDVVPHCLHPELLDRMADENLDRHTGVPVHVEAGKRVYQLYAELDQVDPLDISPDDEVLTFGAYMFQHYRTKAFQGPWGMVTAGNAGGQTIVGAFSTGTHGGDFTVGPLTDSVLAIHLVADGGKHYWIEKVDERYWPQLTDDDRLHALYDPVAGRENFKIIRQPDNAMFNAAVVSVGRFGIIYSVVLEAVPQYARYERRRLHVWQDFKHQILDPESLLYCDTAIVPGGYFPSTNVVGPQRFLQIAVCLTPHDNFTKNVAGVTKQWAMELQDAPPGRAERVGEKLMDWDPRIQGPRFSNAGRAHSYRHDPDDPLKAEDDSDPLALACSNGSFLEGVIEAAYKEIEEFVESNGVVVGAGIAGVVAFGGAGLLALIPALLLILLILKSLLEAFDADDRFGEHMEKIKNALLDPNETDPLKRAAGLFAWQLIVLLAFRGQQSERDYEAINYAVLDQKDYRNINCEVNVDSVEVFFSAVDHRLLTFVDALIAYEIMQEFKGKAFVGYASLRFMGSTEAKIGMQRHHLTCAVEVACLKDVSGGQEMIDYAVRLALNPNIGGILHWGQRNDATAADIQRLFGNASDPLNGDLGAWRRALDVITASGTHNRFSSDFTRRTGLEL